MKIIIFGNILFIHRFSTQFLSIISKASTLCIAKVWSQENSKFTNAILQGEKISSFLHFKCYNLAFYAVKLFEINSLHYFSSLEHNPIFGLPKNKEKSILCNSN